MYVYTGRAADFGVVMSPNLCGEVARFKMSNFFSVV